MAPPNRPTPTQHMKVYIKSQPQNAPPHRQLHQRRYKAFPVEPLLSFHPCWKCYCHQPDLYVTHFWYFNARLQKSHTTPSSSFSTLTVSLNRARTLQVSTEVPKRYCSVPTIRSLALISCAIVENLFEWLTINRLGHKCDQIYSQMEIWIEPGRDYWSFRICIWWMIVITM